QRDDDPLIHGSAPCSILTANRPESYVGLTSLSGVINSLLLPPLPPPRMTADVYETVDGDAYIVEVPVPGLDVNDISVEATPQDLTVSVRPVERNGQSNEGRRYLQHEQQQAPMARVFEFPTEIEPDNITAKLEAEIGRASC